MRNTEAVCQEMMTKYVNVAVKLSPAEKATLDAFLVGYCMGDTSPVALERGLSAGLDVVREKHGTPRDLAGIG